MTKALIVVQKNDHSLGYYDPGSGAELSRVPLDPFPHEFVLSADRRFAYCCHFGVALAEDEGPGGNSVSIVDLRKRARCGTLDCGEWRRPHGIAMDNHGRLYVLSEASGELLIAPDPRSGKFDRHQPANGEGAHIVTVTGDGRLAFTSNMKSNTVSILFTDDPERDPLILAAGQRPEGSVLNAAEDRLFVVNRESADITVIDLRRCRLLEPIATPPGPVRVVLDPAGKLLIPLYHAKGLARIDPAEPIRQELLELPGKPVSIGTDVEDNLCFLSTLSDEVCVVDLESFQLVRRISTRSGPDPVAAIALD